MLVDTHCHLHDREFFSEEQAEEMVARARAKGVERIICIGTSHEDSLAAQDFANKHENVYWTYGIHPEHGGLEIATACPAGTLQAALAKSSCPAKHTVAISKPPIAVGEVGLDYHYDGYDREGQIKLFEEMLQLAVENGLPVSFHVREAFEDFFGVVNNFPTVRGVVHSFTDSKKTLKRILTETDFYVGVNGLSTYSTLPTPPLQKILLETDAPFLTPVPFRGIINESGYVREVAKWLSQKLATDFETIERETTKNAESLFHF